MSTNGSTQPLAITCISHARCTPREAIFGSSIHMAGWWTMSMQLLQPQLFSLPFIKFPSHSLLSQSLLVFFYYSSFQVHVFFIEFNLHRAFIAPKSLHFQLSLTVCILPSTCCSLCCLMFKFDEVKCVMDPSFHKHLRMPMIIATRSWLVVKMQQESKNALFLTTSNASCPSQKNSHIFFPFPSTHIQSTFQGEINELLKMFILIQCTP